MLVFKNQRISWQTSSSQDFWSLLTYYFNIILISLTMHVKLSLGKLVRCIKNICFQLLLLFCGTHFIMYSKCFWGSKLHLQKDLKIFIRVLFRLQLFSGLSSCKATKSLHDQHLLPSYFEPKSYQLLFQATFGM